MLKILNIYRRIVSVWHPDGWLARGSREIIDEVTVGDVINSIPSNSNGICVRGYHVDVINRIGY